MSPATLRTWAKGYERRRDGAVTAKGPIITALEQDEHGLTIPFIGLVEAVVVQAFRETGLPMQRIRKALDVLARDGELEHALARDKLYTDGAEVLFNYAEAQGDKQLRLLVVRTNQLVFTDVIRKYLKRIEFVGDDPWPRALVLPVTERELLRVVPTVDDGEPLFINGGAPLSAVASRIAAGEPVTSVAADYGVPEQDVREAIDAIWPKQKAA